MSGLFSLDYFREKYFSDRSDSIESSIGQCYKLATEFIKVMEMYDKDPDDVKHWIDGMYSCINQCYNIPNGYSYMFSRIPDKLGEFPSDVKDYVNSLSHSDDLFNEIRLDIIKKYHTYFRKGLNDMLIDNYTYQRYLLVLYLVLVGRINVDSINLEMIWDNKYNNIQVSVRNDVKNKYIKPNDIKRILYKFIYHLNGDQGVLSKFV